MYKVLLVDDETNVLDTLKSGIDWQGLGVDMVYTALDGQEALEVFEREAVDLLVTDIRMPRVDGLQLVRSVRSLYPETHCILLTAYSEFDYAKEAIRLGVENYLLKPIVKEEIEQTVQNALDNLYQRRQNSEGLARDNTLRRWLHGSIGSEELGERAAVLGINLYFPTYCVVCVVKRDNRQSISMFRSACVEELSQSYDVYHLWDEKGRYVIVLGGRGIMPEGVEQQLEQVAKQTGTDNLVAVSVGTIVQETDFLHLSYQMACDSLELSNLATSPVIVKNDIDAQGFEADLIAEEIRMLFYGEEATFRANGYRHLALKLYKQARGEALDRLLGQMMKACIRVLLTEFPACVGLQEKVYALSWECSYSLHEEEFLMVAVRLLEDTYKIFHTQFLHLSPVVQQAIKYIRNSVGIGEGLSIKVFCSKNGMNPAYLGHTFKKETGTFFNDYLNQCRINQSIILMRNPERKIKDIALRVGFTTVSYYMKCFRDIKGVSPAKYRKGTG